MDDSTHLAYAVITVLALLVLAAGYIGLAMSCINDCKRSS